jgi:hypothetical protein
VRRGNTILELYDPQDFDKLINVLIGRKGLPRFFDIGLEFFSRENRYRDDHLDHY